MAIYLWFFKVVVRISNFASAKITGKETGVVFERNNFAVPLDLDE